MFSYTFRWLQRRRSDEADYRTHCRRRWVNDDPSEGRHSPLHTDVEAKQKQRVSRPTLEVMTMKNSINLSRNILASALLIFGMSVVLQAPPTLGAPPDAQNISPETSVRGELRPYGPPSKGFYYTYRPATQAEIECRKSLSWQIGPPSTRIPTGYKEACHNTSAPLKKAGVKGGVK